MRIMKELILMRMTISNIVYNKVRIKGAIEVISIIKLVYIYRESIYEN